MAITCPNTNLNEWKDLVKSRGEDVSYFLWNRYNGNVPQSEYDVSYLDSGYNYEKAFNNEYIELKSEFEDVIYNYFKLNGNNLNGINNYLDKLSNDFGIKLENAIAVIDKAYVKYKEAPSYSKFRIAGDTVKELLPSNIINTQQKLLNSINNNMGKISSNKFNEKLKGGFLKDFNVSVQEYDNIKKALNLNSTQAVSLIEKFIAVQKGANIDKSVAYLAYSLLGKKNSKIKSDLRYNIYAWEKYKEKFNKYKKEVFQDKGFVDSEKEWKRLVNDKIIVDYLGETIVEYFNNPLEFEQINDRKWTKEDFTFFRSLIREIKKILGLNSSSEGNLKNTAINIAHEVLTQEYDILNYELSEEQFIKNYEETIGSDQKAKDIVEYHQSNDIILTGSLALRKSGSVYRTEDETLHDLDFVVPYQLSKNEESFLTKHRNILAASKIKPDIDTRTEYANRIIPEFIWESKWYKDFINKYPNYKHLTGFIGSENSEDLASVTLTGVIDGEFDSNGEYVKGTGYIIDHFVRLKENQEEHENYFKLWKEIMIAKLMMAREKDFKDFKAFVPFRKSKDSYNFYYPSYIYVNNDSIELESKEILLQSKGTEGTASSEETLSKVKIVLDKMGVSMQSLTDYAKDNPNVDVSNVNALADLSAGIIAIAEGKEDVALVEEMVHISTAIIEQTDPKLITELIRKIGDYKIYKDTLAEYRDLKAYQLPNGKPNIRKIKKEAVDKLIKEIIVDGDVEAYTEDVRSLARKMWDKILGWFRIQYKKADINLFSKVSERVLGGDFEGNVLDLNNKEIYYQVTDAQKEFLRNLEETNRTLEKIETDEKVDPLLEGDAEVNSYYQLLVDGEYVRIKKRVTDRVKRYYRSKFPAPTFTKEEEADNEVKRTLGTKYHLFFEEIHDRFFDSDGSRRATPGKRPNITDNVDDQVYTKLEKYYTDLIATFSKDGKNPLVLSEVQVYDKKEKEAGTIDLLIVDEDGKGHIFDWKFMSVAKDAEDVAWFKQGAYGIQLNRYREILLDNYGIKSIGKNRAIPIIMDLKRDNYQDLSSPLKIKGIKIGSVDPSKLDSLLVTPVSAPTELTGIKKLDLFIKQLNDVTESISNKNATTDDDKAFKSERLNIINNTIRSIQGQEQLGPLVDTIEIMIKQGENLLAEWKTSYEGVPANSEDINNQKISDYSSDLREYRAVASVFSKVTNYIGDLIYKEGDDVIGSEENKELLQMVRNKQQDISELTTELDIVSGEFAEKFYANRNGVTGLMKPEKVVKGFSSYFKGLSTIGLKATNILYKLANDAANKAERDTLISVDKLISIQNKIKADGGDISKRILKLYRRDKKGSIVNELIYKYKEEFYKEVKRNSLEGNRDKKWLANNTNVKAYMEEANKKLDERIDRISKTYPGEQLAEKRESLILKEKRKWDPNREDFNGWDNYIMKRHPTDKWLSDGYIELQKDPNLFELYNFITDINKKANEIGYLRNAVMAIFLPFIRKSMAESFAWDGPNLKAVNNFAKNLQTRTDDIGYGKINALTGEIEQGIPKYYTKDFSLNEDGTNDYSDVSMDLFKNMIVYIQHVNKYKYMSEIEEQVLMMKTTQTFKDHLRSNKFGKVVPGETLKGNEENVKIIDQFARTVMYEEKYALDDSDIAYGGSAIKATKNVLNFVGKKLGKKDNIFNEDEPTVNSLTKTMEAMNRYTQLKSLGLNPISGSANAFGGNLQINALAGKYFDAREVYKNQANLVGNKFKDNDDRTMFLQLLDKFMPLKDDPTYDRLKQAGMKLGTRINYSDVAFFIFRDSEQLLEKGIFKALLQNMMVVDGRIVNIRDYVRDKYKSEYSSGTAAERSTGYRNSKQKIKQEIAELKKNNSIYSTKKLVDGKVVIPGLDLNNQEELMRVTNVAREISRTATGGLTEYDIYRANMNIWFKSAMVFKGWIPKLVDTRFGEFRKSSDNFNIKVDENGQTTGEKFEVGRIKLFWSVVGLDISKSIKTITDINKMNEDGVKAIDKIYEQYTQEYIDSFGEAPNISKEDFMELVKVNLNRQVKELGILVGMFALVIGLGVLAPDDDEDRATKNAFRYIQRISDKFLSEILFFYNPGELTGVISGGLPAIGLFDDFGRAFFNFTKEVTGMDISDPSKTPEEVREQAQPIKNMIKLVPLGNPILNFLASINENFAKEFDITIQKTNR